MPYDIQVQRVIEEAAKLGIEVHPVDADHYLIASELLKSEPPGSPLHTLATEVVTDFARHLATGVDPRSFAGFALPERKNPK
jgi:hypothetical protein